MQLNLLRYSWSKGMQVGKFFKKLLGKFHAGVHKCNGLSMFDEPFAMLE